MSQKTSSHWLFTQARRYGASSLVLCLFFAGFENLVYAASDVAEANLSNAEAAQNVNLFKIIQNPNLYSGRLVSTEAFVVIGGRRKSTYGAMSLDGLWAYEPEVMLELRNTQDAENRNPPDISKFANKHVNLIGRIIAIKSEANTDCVRAVMDVYAAF